MIGLDYQFIDTSKLVIDRSKDASFKSVGHMVAAIRKDAQASIDISPEPSRAGTPPHSRDGRLGRAIVFDVKEDVGIVGPRESVVGLAGQAHELGVPIGDDDFAERSFMEPSLEKNLHRFGESYAASM